MRLLAGRDGANALAHEAPQHRDAAVGRAEMFGRVDRDRPLRHLGVEIPRDALPLFVGAFAGLTKEVEPDPAALVAEQHQILAEG